MEQQSKTAKHFLLNIINNADLNEKQYAIIQLAMEWKKILKDYASILKYYGVEGDTVVASVSHPAYMFECTMKKADILSKINTQIPSLSARDIKIIVI